MVFYIMQSGVNICSCARAGTTESVIGARPGARASRGSACSMELEPNGRGNVTNGGTELARRPGTRGEPGAWPRAAAQLAPYCSWPGRALLKMAEPTIGTAD